jgi:SPOR domain
MPAEVGPSAPRDPLRALYEREQRRRRPRSRLLAAAAAVCVLGAFGVIVYYAYHEGVRAGSESIAPLIKAEQQPYKVKPDDPGGMDVPDQDKLIYNEVSPQAGEGAQKAEHLLPPPENPLPRPTEQPQEQAQSSSAASAAAAPATGPVQASPAGTPSYVPQPPAPAEIPPIGQSTPPQAQGNAPGVPAVPGASGTSGQASAVPPAASAQGAKAAKTGAAGATQLAARPQHGTWRVQLGSVRSAERAQQEWAQLQKQHPDLLGSLALNVQRADLGPGKGVFYRIQGGPLSGKEAANALCDRLKAVRVGCLAVEP